MIDNIERKVFKFWSDERNYTYIVEELGKCIEQADKSDILEDVDNEDRNYMVSLLYLLLCENSRKYCYNMQTTIDSSKLSIPESYTFYTYEDSNMYNTYLTTRIGEDLFHEDNRIYTSVLLHYLQSLGFLSVCFTTKGTRDDDTPIYKFLLFLNYDNLYSVYENCLDSMIGETTSCIYLHS